MTIRPEQVRALVDLLRQWGYEIKDQDEQDLIAEFDTLIEKDLKGGGKFRRNDPDTSKWAASADREDSRVRVLLAFYRIGSIGLTNDEMYQLVDPERGRERDSWVPRVGELKRMGLVTATNFKRAGKKNVKQEVNIITPDGKALVRQRGWE